jgi:hypothetical protein
MMFDEGDKVYYSFTVSAEDIMDAWGCNEYVANSFLRDYYDEWHDIFSELVVEAFEKMTKPTEEENND